MRDFIDILNREDYYDERNHNKTENLYNLWGTTWEFISVDEPQKVRGRKRNICFVNEANELTFEDFQQLILRTTDKFILDYNPSNEYHWLYDLADRDDADFFRTTYKDNPFLSQDTIDEIERLKTTDENYWRVYGLGLRGQSREVIFQTETYKDLPEGAKRLAYGLDWGFSNDPTSLVAVYEYDNGLYIEELLYKGMMTNQDIADHFKDIGIDRRDEIIADSAEPKSIEDLHRMGYNVKPAKKGPDSIRAGIDIMRRKKLYIHEGSLETRKEFRNYKWMTDRNNRVLNKPVDAFNHSVDATRYVCLVKLSKKRGQYFIR